mgnify:CR=1 FL=1
MKATGIVRRIDELGRVVIPKEIRRTQRIRRGDPLEIFTTGDGEVIFKKYSPMGELSGVTAQYVDVLSKCFALTAFVSDRDRILAASGAGRRDLADRSVRAMAAPKRHCCPARAHPGRCCALCPSLRRGMSPAVWACSRRTALPSPMPPSSRR